MHDEINEATFMINGHVAPLASAAIEAEVFGACLARQLYSLEEWTEHVDEMQALLARVTVPLPFRHN